MFWSINTSEISYSYRKRTSLGGINMARFYGVIGFADTTETAPGVWMPNITKRNYSGDVLKNTKKWQSGESLNDNLTVNNIFSIMADSYAYEHLFAMRFIEWMGASWKITNVEVQRPRLILTIGGVYNE